MPVPRLEATCAASAEVLRAFLCGIAQRGSRREAAALDLRKLRNVAPQLTMGIHLGG